MRTTRYYSLSNADLSSLGSLQTISLTCFSLGTGFLFTFLQIDQSTPTRDYKYLWISVAFYVAGTILWIRKGTHLTAIKREHQYSEDHLTLLAKMVRYWRSRND